MASVVSRWELMSAVPTWSSYKEPSKGFRGFRVWGLGFRVEGFGLEGLGFTAQGRGFRVEGLGLRV